VKIAIVSTAAPPVAVSRAGAALPVRVAGVAAALSGEGHQVTVYTASSPPEATDELPPAVAGLARELGRRWAVDAPDVVHAYSWASGASALLARRDAGVPVVVTFAPGGTAVEDGRAGTGRAARLRLQQVVAREADHVVATSGDEADRLTRLGVPRRGVSVVPCGVDVERFTEDGPVWPPRHHGRARVLGVGRLGPGDRFDILVGALRAVPAAELFLVGGPPVAELPGHPEAQRLRGLAERLGVQDRLCLMGRVAHGQLPALMRSADVVACIPSAGSSGLVALEAMACRRPVLATTVGGLGDTVADGVTGVLVPSDRPERVAAALRGMLRDPFQLEALGQAGIDRARARYRWDRIARETVGVYEQVLVRAGRAQTVPAGTRG
jgi:D-inositol-3-phosphate glycosyltransferase